MQIEIINIDEIKPYQKNAKLHPQRQIEQIIESIKQFGNNDPIAIDEKNVIIEGHGRYEALKQMGVTEVPVIKLKHLKAQQKKAYILAHNKLTMNSDFDIDILNEELEAITDIDMSIFDFEPIIDDEEEEPEDYRAVTDTRVRNIQNLEYADFQADGKYGIPIIKPLKKMPNVKEWIPFNYVLSDKDPRGKGVHFFIHDYQFERVWNNPDDYIDKLKQYECVLTPDFSPYMDMPLALRIYNHYRKQWCGAYWQEHGIKVIPTVRACEEDAEFCFEGIPTGGIIAISTMGLMNDEEVKKQLLDGYEKEMLDPKKILIYSNVAETKFFDGMGIDYELIRSFSQKRWNNEEKNKCQQEK